jgi:hypothetical protein
MTGKHGMGGGRKTNFSWSWVCEMMEDRWMERRSLWSRILKVLARQQNAEKETNDVRVADAMLVAANLWNMD